MAGISNQVSSYSQANRLPSVSGFSVLQSQETAVSAELGQLQKLISQNIKTSFGTFA